MESKNKFSLFQEIINDINEIRDSLDMEEVNETCFNIEQKWNYLQEKYSKFSCVYLYLGCPYKKKEKKKMKNKKEKQIEELFNALDETTIEYIINLGNRPEPGGVCSQCKRTIRVFMFKGNLCVKCYLNQKKGGVNVKNEQ